MPGASCRNTCVAAISWMQCATEAPDAHRPRCFRCPDSPPRREKRRPPADYRRRATLRLPAGLSWTSRFPGSRAGGRPETVEVGPSAGDVPRCRQNRELCDVGGSSVLEFALSDSREGSVGSECVVTQEFRIAETVGRAESTQGHGRGRALFPLLPVRVLNMSGRFDG